LKIIVVNLVEKFYAVAKISQIYCWGILIWATLYISVITRVMKLRETVRVRLLEFLADPTATQYARLLASSCRPSVRLSVTLCMHCGSQGWCTGLKVVPTCSCHASFYFFLLSS